ncbi:MAG: hypothetical protein DWQ05_22080 [Calditrichaeota bacterium]|nr:MAG: hypothetical protein DWQ05_22080 [Calditrichota bacterium]
MIYRLLKQNIALFFIAAISVSANEKKPIAIGPYLQNVTSKSAVVCWATFAGQSTLTYPDGKIQKFNEYEHHEMLLDGLQENTTYEYDVLGDGSAAGKGKVTTFPKKIEPFQFVVLGDTRSRHDIHKRNIERIMAENPLFVVNTGDLVGNGRRIQDWDKFFELNNELMRNIPYFPVLGNHEKDSKFYFEFFNLPGNERYYSFNVGDALFLFLDTEGEDYQTPQYLKTEESREYYWNNHNLKYFEEQKAWVEHQLTINKDAGFVFVFFHQPLFSVKKTRVEDAKLRRKFWGDIFERHGVQVVLNGHDHHYHRAFNGGTHYITTAGGGAGLYEPDTPQPETKKISKIEHIVKVEVGPAQAHLTAIDINGNIIEKIHVDKK